MYEHRSKRPIPRGAFVRRLFAHAGVSVVVIVVSLAIGMSGYHYFERLPWLDAFLNAGMLLGGMGPVNPIRTEGGKLFAGLYALYAGLVVLAVAGLLFAPLFHRILHRLHWEDAES